MIPSTPILAATIGGGTTVIQRMGRRSVRHHVTDAISALFVRDQWARGDYREPGRLHLFRTTK